MSVLKGVLWRTNCPSAHQADKHGQFELYHSMQILWFVVFLWMLWHHSYSSLHPHWGWVSRPQSFSPMQCAHPQMLAERFNPWSSIPQRKGSGKPALNHAGKSVSKRFVITNLMILDDESGLIICRIVYVMKDRPFLSSERCGLSS